MNVDKLKAAIREGVRPTATIHTDQLNVYAKIGRESAGGHKTVNHSQGEYSRDGVNTSSAGSFFARLKRGVRATLHHISKKHLPCYCDEFSFRWGERKVTDGQRTVEAIKGAEGKRLLYTHVPHLRLKVRSPSGGMPSKPSNLC